MNAPTGVRGIDAGRPAASGLGLGARAPAWVGKALREPLVHFVILGLALFLIFDAHRDVARDHKIVLDQARVATFVADYRAEFGQAPTAAELRSLAHRYVQDEILYREGLALGLDKDDEVVRRRVVQKMQFLAEDSQPQADVSPARLAAYYRSHLARYVTPERVSFSHVFFSLDKGEAAARARAETVLAGLGPNGPIRAPERGDRFSDLYDYVRLDAEAARRLFGRTEVAAALAVAPVGRWSGPYRSAYGWHLLRVSAREPSVVPPLDQVADRVRSDVLDEARTAANAAAFVALSRRYRVVGDRAGLTTP